MANNRPSSSKRSPNLGKAIEKGKAKEASQRKLPAKEAAGPLKQQDASSGVARRQAMDHGPKKTAKTAQLGNAEDPDTMNRMNRDRWQRQVDANTLGAHYSYVVGDHGAVRRHQAAPVRAEHDRRPATGDKEAAARSTVGINDRSRRLQDGKGARDALMPQDVPFTAWIDDNERTMDMQEVLTQALPAAGQSSDLVSYNRLVRCCKDGETKAEALDKGENWESANIQAVLGQAVESLARLPAKNEDRGHGPDLQYFGCKIKPKDISPGGHKMLPHRGNEDNQPVAGAYDQEKESHKQCQQNLKERSGIARTLQPGEGDTTPSERVTTTVKGKALYSGGYSEETAKRNVLKDPGMFRYSHWDGASRSRAVPSEHFEGGAGVASPQRGGRESGGRAQRRHGGGLNQTGVAASINREEGERANNAARSARKKQDKDFDELCKYAEQNKQENQSRSKVVNRKDLRSHTRLLAWE